MIISDTVQSLVFSGDFLMPALRLTTESNSQTFKTLILGGDVGRGEYSGREAGVI
jgi:hypothetical protein